MDIAFEQSALEFEKISHHTLADREIKLTIARLDKIHADVSGNKLFKLHYFLEEALVSSHKKILTFGGAYSNHLVATAFAANTLGLHATGIVRGEESRPESHTLKRCLALGMKLSFISRAEYSNLTDHVSTRDFIDTYGDTIVIPEGGYDSLGAKGASLIMQRLTPMQPTHVCVPVGTATTLAGLLLKGGDVKIIGVPVIKNMLDLPARIKQLSGIDDAVQLSIFDSYHFGGYAKTTPALLTFMNYFFRTYNIPLDFVYTAKMMFGVMEQIMQGFFPAGSHIICLHTGGLQGNKSLRPYNLTY